MKFDLVILISSILCTQSVLKAGQDSTPAETCSVKRISECKKNPRKDKSCKGIIKTCASESKVDGGVKKEKSKVIDYSEKSKNGSFKKMKAKKIMSQYRSK
jgi:hypothetical protein